MVYFENIRPSQSFVKIVNPQNVHLIQYIAKLGSTYKTFLMAFSHLFFNYLKTLKLKRKLSCP